MWETDKNTPRQRERERNEELKTVLKVCLEIERESTYERAHTWIEKRILRKYKIATFHSAGEDALLVVL